MPYPEEFTWADWEQECDAFMLGLVSKYPYLSVAIPESLQDETARAAASGVVISLDHVVKERSLDRSSPANFLWAEFMQHANLRDEIERSLTGVAIPNTHRTYVPKVMSDEYRSFLCHQVLEEFLTVQQYLCAEAPRFPSLES